MTTFLLAVFFLTLALGGVIVRKTYIHIPLIELKRLAGKKDSLAVKIYPAAAYEHSLRLFLSLWIVFMTAAGFVLLSRVVPFLLSVIFVAILLWVAYSWLPSSRITSFGARLTVAVTPAVIWLLGYLYPLLSRTARLLRKRFSHLTHTGIFERQDFIELIERQQHQPDNRLSAEELEIAKRALSFEDYKVNDVLTPRKHIKSVVAGETMGPILIDELHQAGQSHVLVRESKKGAFVGTIDFKHLDLLHTGKVQDVMNPKVYYLHENDRLSDALHAFFVTNHPVFIVVNSFEEYLGILTIENVLKQLLGHVPGDDFDRYNDLAAVAARHTMAESSEKVVE